MITELKILIKASAILLLTNSGVAQENTTVENPLGTAYEFSGASKFITFPSKFLFGNPEVLDAIIVNGYEGNIFEILRRCSQSENPILLEKGESEWWNKPTYTEIPQLLVTALSKHLLDESRTNENSGMEQSTTQGIASIIGDSFSDNSSSSEKPGFAMDTIENMDVAILDIPTQQFNKDCRNNFAQKQFLVDERIVQLANSAGLHLENNTFQ